MILGGKFLVTAFMFVDAATAAPAKGAAAGSSR
jgi:hypothetical protein